ncbi:ParA-like dsDNA partitioning protein [Mycobacterium phage Refuge]|uniref:ParA-like dsDNA partitioning protein n=1 Tax=Mycobacterium phage Refuge TaxID=2517967 RepID=A0A482JB46_9CAUD|nr:ParA-like partition protein [Mycobacterium phage Refuge]QBP31057.1 ParA-like dsDNA partitioning protein [Mycobacterium phage Refuge]
MTTISIVHTKGGVGKTTSSMYLAFAASRLGMDVAVFDADPQKSATEWVMDTKGGVPFPVIEARRGRFDLPPNDLVFVDTPPGTSGIIDAAVAAADLVIIPCGPSPLDIRRVWPTLEITAHKPTRVLLTAVDLRAKLGAEVRAALEAQGVSVFTNAIGRRESMRREYGTVPTHLNGYDDVLAEMVVV